MTTKPHIVVVGAGTMGRGIAQVALGAGHLVSLVDPSPAQLNAAVDDLIGRLTRKDPTLRDELALRLSTHVSLASVSTEHDVVLVEAALEDLAVKQAIFQEALALFGPGCILATNTSSLSITEIAAGVDAADRVVGMHFFNPVPVMRLVEVVDGLATDPAVSATIAELATSWGKDVARAKSAPGFIVNRVARPFYGEALRLLEENVASVDVIDEALRGAGRFRMGPFELMDLIGLDVNFTVTCTVWAAFNHDPRFAPSPIQRELVAGGFLGRKSGRGFHRYDDPQPVAAPPTAAGVMPDSLVLRGDCRQLEQLLERASVAFSRTAGDGMLEMGDAGRVMLTRGLTAAEESLRAGLPVVVIDRCLDPTDVSALALAGTSEELLSGIETLLAIAGVKPLRISDTPGLVLARVVSMLANEAFETAHVATASPEDIDTAMRLGTNYPEGPFAWADRWGTTTVVEILDNLWDEYRDARYRTSQRLRGAVRLQQVG